VKLVLLLAAVVLSAPLVAFAAHLWRLGARVRRAREFPPPGYRVVRDTAVVSGQAAMSRGRALGALALGLGAASVLVWLLLWRLARLLGARPAPRSVGAAPAGPTRRDI